MELILLGLNSVVDSMLSHKMETSHGKIFSSNINKTNCIDLNPSMGSCHHGMAHPLGCGWGSRPPDMEVSCEYIE